MEIFGKLVALITGMAGIIILAALWGTVCIYLGWNEAVVEIWDIGPITFKQSFFLALFISCCKSTSSSS